MTLSQVAAVVLLVSWMGLVYGYPRIGSDDQGFVPSNQLMTKDQLAMETFGNGTLTPSASDKAGRFGFPTYSTDGQPVNNVVPGLYGPVKLDIGGLVLGTIVGFGAFFILPKIFSVISSPYGGFKRSEDEPSVGGSSINEVYRQFSDGMEAMNLDQTACLQRAVCSSVQSAPSADGVFDAITSNDMVRSMLAGTEWDLALKVGRSGDSCGKAFPKCPFSIESVMKPLLKYFLAKS